MNCVILGPSKIEKISRHGNIDNIEEYIELAGRFLASIFREVIIVPDYGLTLLISQKYKEYSSEGVVVGFVPDKTNNKLSKYNKYCDEIRGINGGWFNLNTELTRQSNLVFCFGFSAGVFIELCSVKYNQEYLSYNTRVFVDKRCISGELPPELTEDVKNLFYFKNFDEVYNIFRELK